MGFVNQPNKGIHVIRNIVFDMGNVLIDFNPGRAVAKIASNPSEKDLLEKEIFKSPGWKQLDQGLITVDDHYKDLIARFPQFTEKIKWSLNNWYQDQPELPGMVNLVKEVKQAGYQVFILSNANQDYYCKYAPGMEIFSLFSEITLSSEIKLIKPQQEIYDYFCRAHQLKPYECLFIDDMPENVQAAINAGWQAYHFKNPKSLKVFLQQTLENL